MERGFHSASILSVDRAFVVRFGTGWWTATTSIRRLGGASDVRSVGAILAIVTPAPRPYACAFTSGRSGSSTISTLTRADGVAATYRKS
jgi:hypothetical protein